MSQDSHSLHLQFTHPAPLQLFQRWLASYREGDVEAQQRWGRMLGLQGDELGADEWFNIESQIEGPCLLVAYDTRSSGGAPLALLERLYARPQLGGVVLSTFHDQVGETSAMLFDDGHHVGPDHLRERRPELVPVMDALGDVTDEDDDDGYVYAPAKPQPIGKLRAAQERDRRQAEEAVEAMRDFIKSARESGANPLEMLQAMSLMKRLLRAAGWGLGVLTVGGLLLAYTPLRWWTLPLLLWSFVSYRYISRELGEERWSPSSWVFHLYSWLTPVVLFGGFLASDAPVLQWGYAGASGLLAGLMLWTLADALFGASDSDDADEPASLDAVANEEAPPARWMEVLGALVLSLPSFVTAVLGVIWSLSLPVVRALIG